MAGMLPGVECARRRRFHQSGPDSPGGSSGHGSSTRRSSFCLYTSNNESYFSNMSSVQRSPQSQAYCDDKLGVAAREAKERLDGRLRAQWKPESKRGSSGQQQIPARSLNNNRAEVLKELETEVIETKKKISKRFNWGKLSWKSSEQEECAVCLEELKEEETLMQLPCDHRFHSKCLVPWLHNNNHCPCCRSEL